MGVVNATDDSFSGDGIAGQIGEAVALAKQFREDGVDIIDYRVLDDVVSDHRAVVATLQFDRTLQTRL